MERLRVAAYSVAGVGVVVAVWWLLAATVGADRNVPPPPDVLRVLLDTGVGGYADIFSVTVQEAVTGGAIGVLLALALAAVVLLAPFAEPVVMQIAVVTYCIPVVAVAPILAVLLGAPDPGEPSGTAVVLAGLSVFFTTVVGAVVGFRSADRASLDVVTVYGGSRLTQLRKVQLVAALPALASALQIAAPAAFLGAVLGEFMGGLVETGVGVALVQAGTSLQPEVAWALGLVCAAVAGAGYAAFRLLGRLVTPWAKGASA